MIATIDSTLTLQDRVRLFLNEAGSNYVATTVSDLAAKLRVNNYNVYQALYRLSSLGEIELDKDEPSDGSRQKIIGIKIHKLEPSGRTYQRAAEKAKNNVINIESVEDVADKKLQNGMTALSGYLNQKIAIMEMQSKAKEAGLPEETIKFEPNAYAEEGLLLLSLLKDAYSELKEARQELQMCNFDLDAARRDNEFYKTQRQEETRTMLLAASN